MSEKIDLNDPNVRNNLAKQYVPLLHKIAKQQEFKCPPEMTYEDILGFGQEGIVYAMNTYKDGTSQTFQQYLGWCILHKIQTGINQEGHTVKFSAYHQKKAKSGEVEYVSSTPFSAMNFGTSEDEDEDVSDRIAVLGVEQETINVDEIWQKVCKWTKNHFSERDADMFIKFYGLDGQEPIEGKELAKKYGVSSCCVTVSKKKIIEAIKKNEELKELLIDLL